MDRLRALGRALSESAGFTLVEVLMAVSITSVAVGVIGSGIFQVTAVQRDWSDDTLATKDLRHVGSLFSSDALKAQNVLDDQGDVLACDPPADSVTLIYTDVGGAHSATYSSNAGALSREDESGNVNSIIGTGVVAGSVEFTLCEGLLTLELLVEADKGTTDTMTLRTYVRKLQ